VHAKRPAADRALMMLRHARTPSDFQAFNGKIDYGPSRKYF
jgi:hypothetical protein